MRTALAAAVLALALPALALPALAQDAPVTDDDEVVIDIESIVMDSTFADGRAIRIQVERDGDGDERRILLRRGDGDGERVFRIDVPDMERFAPLRDMSALFDGDGMGQLLRGLGSQAGISPETRQRMRDLEAEARALARQARDGDDAAEARLDAVLGDLFDVRAEARRERAESLRERAQELMEEADAMEASLRDREARRQALIEARRAELLGEPASDW